MEQNEFVKLLAAAWFEAYFEKLRKSVGNNGRNAVNLSNGKG